MGADVIKLDAAAGRRERGPAARRAERRQPVLTMLNCNKRSIVVNMKSAEGKTVFVDLLKKSDIVGWRISTRGAGPARLYLGEDHQLNARVVMARSRDLARAPVRRFQGLRERGAGDGGAMSTTGVPEARRS